MKPYTFLDHTADVLFEAYGKTPGFPNTNTFLPFLFWNSGWMQDAIKRCCCSRYGTIFGWKVKSKATSFLNNDSSEESILSNKGILTKGRQVRVLYKDCCKFFLNLGKK